MNKLYLLACSVLWLFGGSVFSQDIIPNSIEYWMDMQFDRRAEVPCSGEWNAELDISSLSPGVHTIGLRVSDSEGRWSVPMVKYFIRHQGVGSEENVANVYEWWIDNDFSGRVTGSMDNNCIELEPDFSTLAAGLHSIGFRVGDAQGLWSVPMVKYFLRPAMASGPNSLVSYTYWIDGNHSDAKTVPFTGDAVELELDMSALSKGVHTFSYQACDEKGQLSAPVSRYFLIPESPVCGEFITAYEYWFNHGPHIRVDVEPQDFLTLDNVWIKIQDVVPNRIPDNYLFVPSEETVYCEDDVFFGMQVLNEAGRNSLALLSDTFHITVAVDPHVMVLENNVECTFDAPATKGRIQGLKMDAHAGDSLYWEFTNGSRVDFYTSDGMRMDISKVPTEWGTVSYGMKVKGGPVYALVYDASPVMKEMSVKCSVVEPNHVGSVVSSFGYHTAKNMLIVNTDKGMHMAIVNSSGCVVVEREVDAGMCRFDLPSGIYIITTDNHDAVKVLVP